MKGYEKIKKVFGQSDAFSDYCYGSRTSVLSSLGLFYKFGRFLADIFTYTGIFIQVLE